MKNVLFFLIICLSYGLYRFDTDNKALNIAIIGIMFVLSSIAVWLYFQKEKDSK
jgi:hypothetical protein